MNEKESTTMWKMVKEASKKNKSAMTCEMVEEAANARKSPCIAVVSLKLVHVLFRLLTHAMLQMHLYCNLFCDMHRKQR